MSQDGSLQVLRALSNRLRQEPDTVGWMGDWNSGDATYTYLAGVLFHPGTPVPDGYVSREIATGEMAVGWIAETEDEEGGDMHVQASAHINHAMHERGYEYDDSRGGFEMEYYAHDRFHLAEQRGEKVILDFYSP